VGKAMGFMHVEAGPMVRSSYMAHRPFELPAG
jgi:lipoate synthase